MQLHTRQSAALVLAALLSTQLIAAPFARGQQRVTSPTATPARTVDLVVFLVVDQMRPDYFERWSKQLSGGLARIRRESVFMPDGQQAHALTETAPGHASLATGRFPAHTNIWANDRGVVDANYPLLLAAGEGAAPIRLRGTTFYDWLRASDSGSRALSVSRKNRSAILMVGRAKEQVFWWGGASGFTTSAYYGDTLPTWIRAWNANTHLERLNGYRWLLSRSEADYPEPDVTAWERGGKDNTFPHGLDGDAAAIASQLEILPLMDSITIDAALSGVRALALGKRGHTDYVSMSLSTTDAIGHRYGPDSRELHDQVLRLDAWLGDFLKALDGIVPAARRIVVLSADHGVTPYAEALQAHGEDGGRVDMTRLADSVARAWRTRWGTDFGVKFDNGLLYGDYAAMIARGIDAAGLARTLAARVGAATGVDRTYTRASLAAAQPTDGAAAAWRRTLSPDADWIVAAVAKRGWVFTDDATKAQHGTWSPIDQRVPIAFIAPGIAPETIRRQVMTVNIAPTLAALLGVRVTEPIDGSPIPELVRAGDTRRLP